MLISHADGGPEKYGYILQVTKAEAFLIADILRKVGGFGNRRGLLEKMKTSFIGAGIRRDAPVMDVTGAIYLEDR